MFQLNIILNRWSNSFQFNVKTLLIIWVNKTVAFYRQSDKLELYIRMKVNLKIIDCFGFIQIFFIRFKQVDFPAVTICSPGMSSDNLESGFYKLFFAFLAANNVNINLSPYSASSILSKVKNIYSFQGVKLCVGKRG